MQLLLDSLPIETVVHGAPCRVWAAETDSGLHCLVFVALLAVSDPAEQAAFEAELRAQLQGATLQPLGAVLRGGA